MPHARRSSSRREGDGSMGFLCHSPKPAGSHNNLHSSRTNKIPSGNDPCVGTIR